MIPLVQFRARLIPVALFDIVFFVLFCLVMSYYRIMEEPGHKELLLLFGAMIWGVFGLDLALKTLRKNHKYHKNSLGLHLEV